MTLSLPIEAEANELLRRSPLALLVGMTLDQQIPMERAFSAPYDLALRLGHEPDAGELADFDTEELIAVFAQRPALHRFPKAMATRVQQVCRAVVDRYAGDPALIWTDVPDGAVLLARISDLPGFGKQKSQILLALLGKRYGVQPPGWREAAGEYGRDGVHFSVADVVDEDSLTRVREHKQQMKAAAKAAKS